MIGKKLKLLREKKRISQQELADIVGSSQQTISHYENDRVEPDLATLKKFSSFFGVSLDELLDNENGWMHIPRTTGKAADDMCKIFEEHENDKIDAIISPEQLDDIISPYLSEKLTDDVKQRIKEQIIDNIKRIRKNEGKDV
jgi:transcriptional regulator with XRE-family HTH domain